MAQLTQNSWNSGYPQQDGELIIGRDGENPIANTLTAGFGIEIDNDPGEITIRATGQKDVEVVTANTQMIIDRNYITNGATDPLDLTLPAEMEVGSIFRITDIGEGFRIVQNEDQVIHFGNQSTTTGETGNIQTIQDNSSITLMCVVENNEFNVLSSVGNFNLDAN